MRQRQRLEAALAALRGRRALLVGDFVLDAYVYGETVRVSREAPVLVVRRERSEHRLGGAANTAVNLAALGVQTRALGVLGRDEAGDRLGQLLHKNGVDVSALRYIERTTPVKTRILAGAFGTSRQQVLRLDDQPTAPVDDLTCARVAEDLRRLAATADVVVVSDYGLGSVVGAVIEAAGQAAAAGTFVCVDSRFQLRAFRGVSAVTPNAPEAAAAVGVDVVDRESAVRAGALILQRLGCEACLLTQGRHGMSLLRRNALPIHADIVGDEEVTDVTGAGDTVIAAFASAAVSGLGLVNAMRLANCAAGVVVQRAGTAAVSPDDICDAALAGRVELEPWPA